MKKRYKLHKGHFHKRYKNYGGYSTYNGKHQYNLFNIRISKLNEFSEDITGERFFSYLRRQPAHKKLFNFWKFQHKDYIRKSNEEMDKYIIHI